MENELLVNFINLFHGRTDVYGHEEGRAIEEPVTTAVWEGHLEGSDPIGIYPLILQAAGPTHQDWRVKWGCVDFDEGEDDSWIYAQNLRLVLETFGVTGWVERSRSKGYHVWVFLDDWKPAKLVREALLAATQIAKAPLKEINPKQTEMAAEKRGFGNYVRLPYPKVAEGSPRRTMVGAHGESHSLEYFVPMALAEVTGTRALQALAVLYVPPPVPKPIVRGEIDTSSDVMKRLDGLSFTILTKGPREDAPDRSAALFALCNAMHRGDTVTEEEAWELICQADESWGKFIARGDEAELRRMHDKVWS